MGRFTPGERSDTYFIGGWVGPRAGLDGCGKSRPTMIRSRTVQSEGSRYTDYSIRAHKYYTILYYTILYYTILYYTILHSSKIRMYLKQATTTSYVFKINVSQPIPQSDVILNE